MYYRDQMRAQFFYGAATLRERGLAEQLVRRALADARSQNALVVPACSYVAAFIQRHPEYQGLLAPT